MLAAIAIGEFNRDRQVNIAAAKAWKVEGPPCAVTSRAEFEAQGLRIKKMTDYEGVILGRQAGHVACKEIATKGGKGFGSVLNCQFTAPAVVTVKIGEAETAYLIGAGQPATIIIQKKQAQCILAGDRTMGLS